MMTKEEKKEEGHLDRTKVAELHRTTKIQERWLRSSEESKIYSLRESVLLIREKSAEGGSFLCVFFPFQTFTCTSS